MGNMDNNELNQAINLNPDLNKKKCRNCKNGLYFIAVCVFASGVGLIIHYGIFNKNVDGSMDQ